jgi:hypothetical protein
MDDVDEFGRAAFQELIKKTAPRLTAELASRGVSSPDELPLEVARKILEDVLVATSVAHFPTADASKLLMGLRTFTDPLFSQALERVCASASSRPDPFEPAVGFDAAIVLAGFGIPVAPLDKKSGKALGPASRNIGDVAAAFSKKKTALVGYPSQSVEFYVLASDCLRTLRRLVMSDPVFSDIKHLIERSGGKLPPDPGVDFRHFSVLIGRQKGDRIATMNYLDPRPSGGSTILLAGWEEDGVAYGVPDSGLVMMLKQVAIGAAQNPKLSFWLTEEDSRKPFQTN